MRKPCIFIAILVVCLFAFAQENPPLISISKFMYGGSPNDGESKMIATGVYCYHKKDYHGWLFTEYTLYNYEYVADNVTVPARASGTYKGHTVWVTRAKLNPQDNVKKIDFEPSYIRNIHLIIDENSHIEEIHVPKSVTNINVDVAESFQRDIVFYMESSNPPMEGFYFPSYYAKMYGKCIFIVPKGSVERYKNSKRFQNARIYTSVGEYRAEINGYNPPQTTSNTSVNDTQYVDLGLPSGLLWADRNVGASSPVDNGYHFAWGETSAKSIYNWSTYRYCNGNFYRLTKYCTNSIFGNNDFTDGLTTLQSGDDAASYHFGGGARMPTEDEWQELLDNTTNKWTTRNGVKGMLFTSKKNGKSIFLPAAGYRLESSLYHAGSEGLYWSSSLYTNSPADAWYLCFSSDYVGSDLHGNRKCGHSVRLVQQKGVAQPQSVVNNQAKAPVKAEYNFPDGWVDLGLPSGTKWKSTNENGYYTYEEAMRKYGKSLPSFDQLVELMNKCTWKWDDDRKGCIVVGHNGNAIFLPAAGGYLRPNILDFEGSSCFYWTSELSDRRTGSAWYLDAHQDQNKVWAGCYDRCDKRFACLSTRDTKYTVRLVK